LAVNTNRLLLCRQSDTAADVVTAEGLDESSLLCWTQRCSRSSIHGQLWAVPTHLRRVSVCVDFCLIV